MNIQQDLKGIHPRMLSTSITEIPNSPILIVAKCKLDNDYYGALFDYKSGDGYVNRLKMHPHTSEMLVDTAPIYNDVEFAVISNFFAAGNVYELNKIVSWLWTENPMRLALRKKLGMKSIEKLKESLEKQWDKKRIKRT